MKTKQHVALTEKRIELQLWKKWRREKLEVLFAGPFGGPTQALFTFCKTVTTPTALIDFVAAGPWLTSDADVRFEILSLVDATVIRHREKMGLPPFDDALPGQPNNLFLLLREHLAPPPGAQPGLINKTSSMRTTEDDERSYPSRSARR